jgi:hypothetical protein
MYERLSKDMGEALFAGTAKDTALSVSLRGGYARSLDASGQSAAASTVAKQRPQSNTKLPTSWGDKWESRI